MIANRAKSCDVVLSVVSDHAIDVDKLGMMKPISKMMNHDDKLVVSCCLVPCCAGDETSLI